MSMLHNGSFAKEHAMKLDQKLNRILLTKLAEREALLQEGDSTLVQPYIDGLHVDNPVVVPGYDHEQIDAHLRWLKDHHYIDAGGAIDEPSIGIFFSRITPAGRQAMRQVA
jgi:hypothetical protein